MDVNGNQTAEKELLKYSDNLMKEMEEGWK